MFEAFVLNPGRRKARRSKGRGRKRTTRRRRKRNSNNNQTNRRSVAPNKGVRRRKKRKATKRRRRRNPAASYGINPRRRRRRRSTGRGRPRRRRNHGPASYGINPRATGLLAELPNVTGFKIPMKGMLGTIANNVVNGAAAGGVVWLGYWGSGLAVDQIDEMMGETMAGPYRRPVLFAAVAGVLGTGAAMVAPRGKKALWSILASAGAGVRAFAGFITASMDPPADPESITGKMYSSAAGLGDWLQVGQDIHEAGVDGEVGDFLQVGEDIHEAGIDGFGGDGIEEEEEEELFVG